MPATKEYMVIRKIVPKNGGDTLYEPYVVVAKSPLEASETVASELYMGQSRNNDYEFLAHTLDSFSTYMVKREVKVMLNKIKPSKLGQAE